MRVPTSTGEKNKIEGTGSNETDNSHRKIYDRLPPPQKFHTWTNGEKKKHKSRPPSPRRHTLPLARKERGAPPAKTQQVTQPQCGSVKLGREESQFFPMPSIQKAQQQPVQTRHRRTETVYESIFLSSTSSAKKVSSSASSSSPSATAPASVPAPAPVSAPPLQPTLTTTSWFKAYPSPPGS